MEVQRFIHSFIHNTANGTGLTGRIPFINESDCYPFFVGDIQQLLNKISKAKITDFASPEELYTFEVQILKADFVIQVSELVC